jgi:hypothetical protein
MVKSWKSGWSYLLVAGIGGVGAWFVKPKGDEVAIMDPLVSKVATPAKQGESEGDELLDQFLGNSAENKEAFKAARGGYFVARFEAMKKSFPESSDPAGDFSKLLVKFESLMPSLGRGASVEVYGENFTKLGVLMDQWIARDPKAAFDAIDKGFGAGGGLRVVGNVFLSKFTSGYIEKHGLPALMDLLEGKSNLVNSTATVIFSHVGKNGSTADLKWLQEKAPAYFSDDQAGAHLGRSWNIDQRDELMSAVDADTAAGAVSGIVDRMEGTSGGEWVLTNLKNGGFSEEIRKALASSPMGVYSTSIKGASLEQRLEIMRELGTLGRMGEGTTKNEMIFSTLRQFFSGEGNQDDLLYQLRHGEMTAREVADVAAQKTFDPGAHRNEYNSQMFRTLAEENLPAAMELLDGMSAAEREKQKAYAARWWFRDAKPDEFFKLVESVDCTGNESLKSMLQESWNDKVSGNLSRYGAAYLDWIEALPEGENRTRALVSVTRSGNPTLAAKAGNLLKKQP